MFNNAQRGASMTSRILRLPEVKTLTGLQRSTIYKQVSEGKFPKPISLGDRAVGWLELELHEWLEERIEISRKGDGDQP